MTTPFRLERSPQVERDLRSVLRFLIKSYQKFGSPFLEAKTVAAARLAAIETAMEKLASLPHQGTLLPALMANLRCVSKDRAIFYFTVEDETQLVRVLAVFFGGQDHQDAMLRRLMQEED